nr:hypothetical protein [uncultured Carboxylicivirga sp.]
MTTLYNWRKGTFSSTYEIYTSNQLIGNLKDNSFKRMAYGIIENRKIHFQTTGFWKQQTIIIDADNNAIIGNISYGTWMTKATISLSGKTYLWQYDNIWNTKWSMLGPDGTIIRNSGRTNSGIIESNSNNDMLMLCGLFITNYLLQITVATTIAAMVPLWVTVFN